MISEVSELLKDRIQALFKRVVNAQTQAQLSRILAKAIISPELDQWLVIRAVLQTQHIKKHQRKHQQILSLLQQLSSRQYDQSLVMQVYIKSQPKVNTRYSPPSSIRLFLNAQKTLLFTSYLTQSPNTPIIQSTLNLLLSHLPTLISKQRLQLQLHHLQLLLNILCHLQLTHQSQFSKLQQLITIIKTYSPQRYISVKQQHLVVIRQLLSILSTIKYHTGTASWLFFTVLGQQHVSNFVSFEHQFLLELSEVNLTNIFTSLFTATFEDNCLELFVQVTYLLRQQDNFYHLKHLYKTIVLPIIARRAKAKLHLAPQVYDIVAFYAIGFYQHCDIGPNGLKCILQNINKLDPHTSPNLQHKWINLAFIIAQKNESVFQHLVYESLKKQGFSQLELRKLNSCKYIDQTKQRNVWQVSFRNARKTKNYHKTDSKDFKGIQNGASKCYIISVIQALFTTGQLSRILKQFTNPGRTTVSYHIKQLFQQMKPTIRSLSAILSVDKLKDYGPKDFAYSQTQEDAQQYLSKLLEQIEEEIIQSKEKLLLQQFNTTFKSKISRKLQCQNCYHIIDSSEEQTIHTIPNRASLLHESVEQIDGFRCEKCNKQKFLSKTLLHPTSKIFIVHINRFSFKHGQSRKELVTLPIPRKFMGQYRLKGFVMHIGKNVQCGHYVYYFQKAPRKWIQMNDSSIKEFQLDTEEEQFQREMKAQMTPYLLFYVKQ